MRSGERHRQIVPQPNGGREKLQSDGGPEGIVPFVGLSRQHAALSAELRRAFERVLGSSSFVLGSEVEAFEQEFGGFCGVSQCVGVGSGTVALELALRAAGIGAGDEVVVPAHTFIASALGVVHAGATPVFCDVERDTGLIDPASAAAAVSERTAAIIGVHLYGQMCDMDALATLAGKKGLFLLEDAAQAHGATHRGRRAGSIGDAAAFSFYPSKNLGALGDGGAVCTRDEQLATRVREFRNLGQLRKGEHAVIGANERLDGLQAAFLRAKLPHLESWNDARREHAVTYHRELPEAVVRLTERDATPCIYHLYPVRHPDRETVSAVLESAGVQAGIHYTPAVHEHAALRSLPAQARPVPLSEAERWAAEELSLPMFAELTEAEVCHVAATVAKVLGHEQRRA